MKAHQAQQSSVRERVHTASCTERPGDSNQALLDALRCGDLEETGAYGNHDLAAWLAAETTEEPKAEAEMFWQQQQQTFGGPDPVVTTKTEDHLGDPLVGGPGDKDKKKKKDKDAKDKKKPGVTTSGSGTVATGELGGDRGSVSVTGQSAITYKTAEEDGEQHAVTYNAEEGTVGHTQSVTVGDVTGSRTHSVSGDGDLVRSESVKDTAGNSQGHSTTIGASGVGHSRSTTLADGRSSATNVKVGPKEMAASHHEVGGKGRSGAGMAVNEDELTVNGMFQNNGANLTVGEKRVGGGIDAVRGNTTYSGGVMYDGETGKTTVNLGAKTKKVGANLAVGIGDGEYTADVGASGKIAKASIGGTYINKDEDGVVDSPLLGGAAYSVDNTSGGGVRGSAQYVIGVQGGVMSTEQVRVQQAMGADGTLGAGPVAQTQQLHDRLMAGERLDVGQMPVGQGVEVAQAYDKTGGAMADAAVLSADGAATWSEVSSRGIARTEEGFRIVDQQVSGSKVDGTAAASAVLFDVLEGGYGSTYEDKQVLEFNLDACEPEAVGYAQAYADLGLLPNWDVAVEERGDSDLVSRLHVALDRAAAPGADLPGVRRAVAADVSQANALVRLRVQEAGTTGQCGVEYTAAGDETQHASSWSWDIFDAIGGGSSASDGESRHRRVGPDGEPYLDAAWRDAEATGYHAASVSGAADAGAALAVKVKRDDRTDVDADLSLSAEAIKLIGDQLNSDKNAAAVWKKLRANAVTYWQLVQLSQEQLAQFQKDYPDTLPPPGLLPFSVPGRRVIAPGDPLSLVEVFGAVGSAEAFQELSPDLQRAFVESAAAGMKTPGAFVMDEGQSAGPLDALAAVSLMEGGEERGAALAGIAHALTDDAEQIDADIKVTADRLGGGAAYALELAQDGQAADPVGLDSRDPVAWAQAMAPMFDAARSSHAAADRMLELLYTAQLVGGNVLVGDLLAQHSSAEEVAHRFALKSGWREGTRLYRFVNMLLVGHSAQGSIRASWEETAMIHNADVQHKEETGRSIFENATDGDGLGGCGVSYEQRQIWADQAAAIEPLSPEELAALNAQELIAAKLRANMLAGKAMSDAMSGDDPDKLIAALERFRDAANIYAAEALDEWAWNNQALLNRGAARIRRKASPTQQAKIKSLTADTKSWDISEKMGEFQEVPEKTPLRISLGL